MARKRLNTNLLIALTCGVAVTMLGLYLGAEYYLENAGRAAARAQQYEQEGKWQLAADQWGKAYRRTGDATYGLNVARTMAHTTSDPEAGPENLARLGQTLETVLAGDSNNPDVLRAVIRHYAEDPSFLVGRATNATRKVRDAAEKLVELSPDDGEAQTYLAATTIDLRSDATQGISDDDVNEAVATLRDLAPRAPLDGTGMQAMRSEIASRVDSLAQAEDAQAQLDTFVGIVDGFAEAIGNANARDGRPMDPAMAHVRAGQAYEVAGALAARIVAGDDGESVDQQALQEAAQPLLDRGLEEYRAAVEASKNDPLSTAYLEARAVLSDALLRRNSAANATRQEAQQVLEDLFAARPWDATAASQLANFYRDAGQYAEAVDVLAKVAASPDEDLPELVGHAGPIALNARAFVDLTLADALFRQRREARRSGQTDAAEQRDLLGRAREALASYRDTAAAQSLGDSPIQERVEGQLAIADGNTFAGIDRLGRALQSFEQMSTPAAKREETDLLRLLADVNREAGQTGGEIEYLARAFRNGGRVTDGLRLVQLYAASGDVNRANDTLAILEGAGDRLPSQFRDDVARLKVALASGDEQATALAAMPETTDAERAAKIQAAAAANDLQTAIRVARALYTSDEADPARGRALAALLARTGETDEASGILGRFPDDETNRRLLAQLQGDATDAAESIDDPARRALYEAQLAERDGDTARAIEMAEQAKQAAADGGDQQLRRLATEALFQLYVENNRFEEARTTADELVTLGGDGVGGRTYDVQIAVAQGDLGTAADQAAALAEQYPQSARAQLLRSQVFRRVGRVQEAAASAGAALKLSPTDLRTIIEAAAAYEAAGQPDEARNVIKRGQVAHRNSPRLAQIAESLELRYGDAQPVIAERRQALEANPDDPSAHLRLIGTLAAASENSQRSGDAAEQRRLANEAADAGLAAVEKFPADARFLAALTAVAETAGEDQLARMREAFDRAMTPSDASSLVSDQTAVTAAMNFYARANDLAAAESAVRRHLATIGADQPRERRVGVLLALSQLLLQQGQADAAQDVLAGYEDVTAVQARLITMLASRATSGDQAAIADLRAAAADESTPASALTAAALAELRLGDPDRAADLLRRADSARPDDAATVYLLGVAMGQMDDPNLPRVVELLERSAELNGSNLDALRNLARVHRRMGNRGAAEAALRRLLEASPGDVEGRLTLAQMQLAKSPPDYTAADRYFRGASGTRAENSPVLLLARAQMEADRGRMADAADFGRRAVEQSSALRQAAVDRVGTGGAQPTGEEATAIQLPQFLNGYLDLLLRGGRVEEALREIDVWSRRLKQDSVNSSDDAEPWWLLWKRGEALARMSRDSQARDVYGRAYAAAKPTSPQQADAILVDMGRRLGADAAYDVIRSDVEGEGGDPGAAVTASQLFGQAGQIDRALAMLETARTTLDAQGGISPRQDMILSQQTGTLYLQSDPPQLDRAINAFRTARAIDATSIAVNNNMAYALTLLADAAGSDEQATRYLTEAVDRGREAVAADRDRAAGSGGDANPSILDTYGWAQALLAMRTGDDDQLRTAIDTLRETRESAERTSNAFPEVYLHLARALEAAGEVEAAVEAGRVGVDASRRRRESGPAVTGTTDEATAKQLSDLVARLRQQVAPADDGN